MIRATKAHAQDATTTDVASVSNAHAVMAMAVMCAEKEEFRNNCKITLDFSLGSCYSVYIGGHMKSYSAHINLIVWGTAIVTFLAVR